VTRAHSAPRALGLLLALALAAPARADESFRPAARVAYIAATLAAVRASDAGELRQVSEYARTLARGACSASVERLKVECLMTAARRFCKQRGDADRCDRDFDVVISNALADDQLIPPLKRYEIMRVNKDYRRALARELRRIQGALAVDFRLRTGEAADDAALAAHMDQFCLDTSDETNMAWQTCVSSLVWFIAGGSAAYEK
jgi:hypothetical protein